MALQIVIKVDNDDLDAVAFCLGLAPAEGKNPVQVLQGRVNAQSVLTQRLQDAAKTIIDNAHHWRVFSRHGS